MKKARKRTRTYAQIAKRLRLKSADDARKLEIVTLQKIAVGIWDAIMKEPTLRDTYGDLIGERPPEPTVIVENWDLFDGVE
jgi:hypothetical protein